MPTEGGYRATGFEEDWQEQRTERARVIVNYEFGLFLGY